MIPFFADYINAATWEGMSPSQVHVANTLIYMYFQRHLLQKAVSVFRWKLPAGWSKTLFLYCLYVQGHVAIVQTDKFGVLPQPCTLGGRDVQYQPKYALIANPLLRGNLRPQIGRQCALVRLMPDYGGVGDIINYYAREMSVTVETRELNTLNSKLSYVFGSENKNSAETLKKMFDNVMSGVPATFTDGDLLDRNGKPSWILFTQDVGKNFISPQLSEELRRLECEFAAAVGIPSNLATSKKERVTTVEVDANNVETAVGPAFWLELAQEGCEQAREIFGLDISVDWRYEPDV